MICVFGAGALGGALATRLATVLSPDLISVVARGAHLRAIHARGLKLWETARSEPWVARVRATDEPSELGPQDLVITALKGHQLSGAASGIATLLGPKTRVVMIQNGIPWWYFHGDRISGRQGERIPVLDPGNHLWDLIGPERVIGGIAYQGAEVVAPGEIRITPGGRFILGEPSGALTPELHQSVQFIEQAGWRVNETDRIRNEIWRKLMGNASFNPISALTRATLADMIDDPAVASVIRKLMAEICAVGTALGAEFDISPDERMAVSRPMGAIKTSMLQDLERGRTLEIAPLLEAPAYLARVTSVETPMLDTITALVNRLVLATGA
jgi:2-dehydropantoate 2-reductase